MSAVTAIPTQPDPKHIADFAIVEPWLWRGDQPDDDGYGWLQAHGVRVIVNLRKRNTKKRVRKAAPDVEYLHIPVANDRAPKRRQALQFLELCAAYRPDRTIYLHCRGGKGRTSTFCALVRISQGWSLDRAIAEQRQFGFDPEDRHKRQAGFLAKFLAEAQGPSRSSV